LNSFIESRHFHPISLLSGDVAHEIQGPKAAPGASQGRRKKGEAVMTNFNKHVPAQHSKFSTLVVNLFTGAVLVLAGFLTFAQFANI